MAVQTISLLLVSVKICVHLFAYMASLITWFPKADSHFQSFYGRCFCFLVAQCVGGWAVLFIF